MIDSFDLARCDVAARLPRAVAALDATGCDTLVITNLRNVRYLTGFVGSAATLIVHANAVTLLTDGRYETQAPTDLASAGVADVDIVVTAESGERAPTVKDAFVAAVRGAAPTAPRVGLESSSVTWAQQRRYAGWVGDVWADASLVEVADLVETLRVTKDAGEIARIERAAAIADRAFAHVRPMLLDGVTEIEFGFELDLAMRRMGASERSFETIVASGPNSALPHARPSERRVAIGDLVVVDFGAMIDGYRSDMTRTVMVGEPSAIQQRMLDLVTEAQQAGADAVGPGVACKDIDAACRAVVSAAGWADRFVHGTGHGVGLDIHEAPWVNSRSAATLAPGFVVTVEPGVYLPEVGGVRVEDTVLVTEAGSRPLTHAPKDPILV